MVSAARRPRRPPIAPSPRRHWHRSWPLTARSGVASARKRDVWIRKSEGARAAQRQKRQTSRELRTRAGKRSQVDASTPRLAAWRSTRPCIGKASRRAETVHAPRRHGIQRREGALIAATGSVVLQRVSARPRPCSQRTMIERLPVRSLPRQIGRRDYNALCEISAPAPLRRTHCSQGRSHPAARSYCPRWRRSAALARMCGVDARSRSRARRCCGRTRRRLCPQSCPPVEMHQTRSSGRARSCAGST